MSLRRGLMLVSCVCAVGWCGPAGAARKPAAPTLGTLAQRAAPVDRSVPVQATAAEAASRYEEFLDTGPADPLLEAQALRRLADLRLEQALAAATGATPQVDVERLARHAVEAYRRLLDGHPAYPAREAALYQLARAHEAAGDGAAALGVLDELVARHPRGAHAGEAQFRRGEAFFSAGRYLEADRAYAAVLAHGAAGAFYEQALYKRGWAQLKLGDDAASSATFLSMLDRLLVAGDALRADGDLTRPELELVDDTLRALSLMFAAAEGASTLQAALRQHGPALYEVRLHRALGDLYVEKERYQDAADAYRAYARRQPRDPEAALLLGRATEAYARAGFVELVLESKQERVALYGPRSAYWTGAAGVDPRVSVAVKGDLLDLARHHHALAQKAARAVERDAAVRWYREFLDGFAAAPEAPATRLLLADLLYDGQRYAEAATEYELVAYGHPDAPEASRAGYAVLVALDAAARQASAAERPALDARHVEASLRFVDAFPAHEHTPAVLTRTAGMLFDAEDVERAQAVAQRLLALGARADARQQLVAWTVLAHGAFEAGRYADAERAYTETLGRLPRDDARLPEATERLAASVYRQAEQHQAAGDVDGAVRDFLRVAQAAPGSPVAAAAQFDAASLLLASGRWREGAEVLERFRHVHASHPLVREVDAKLAVAFSEAGEPGRAAPEFERVAAREDQPPELRRVALWQAGEAYATAGDGAAAQRVYASYVARFPQPVGAAIDARQWLADRAHATGDPVGRQRWLEQIVLADRGAGSGRSARTVELAAKASLELARPLDASARAVRLTLPLERTFAARRKTLEAALDAYAGADAYGIVEVSTAATWAMADLYQDLGRALLESDRPRGLDAEELEQYALLLEEQAFPFEEKAIDLHGRNVRRAAQGVYDEWVRQSYEALARLEPARYARTERLGAPVPDASSAVAEARALNREGVEHRRAGRFAAARAAYERAISSNALDSDPEGNLAILLDLYLGDPVAALPHYERCLELASDGGEEVTAWLIEVRTRLAAVARTAEAQR